MLKKLEWCSCFKMEISENLQKNSSRRSPARYRSSAQHCQNEEPACHIFYHFRYENMVKFKNKLAPATLKKCALSVLTTSSPPQSRETVPLKGNTGDYSFADFLRFLF